MKKEDLDFLVRNVDSTFAQVDVDFSSKVVFGTDEVLMGIKEFNPIDGWVSYQSDSAKRIKNASEIENGKNIIAGEFCNASGDSLSVRFNGDGWVLCFCSERQGGTSCLRRTVKQLAKGSDGGKELFIEYAVYGNFADDLNGSDYRPIGYRPFCSAFKGFI